MDLDATDAFDCFLQKLVTNSALAQQIRSESWCYKRGQAYLDPRPSPTLWRLLRTHLKLDTNKDGDGHTMVTQLYLWIREHLEVFMHTCGIENGKTIIEIDENCIDDVRWLFRCVLVQPWKFQLTNYYLCNLAQALRDEINRHGPAFIFENVHLCGKLSHCKVREAALAANNDYLRALYCTDVKDFAFETRESCNHVDNIEHT
jgi:hypothetical protein